MRNQPALGVAGGAAGVNQHGRLVGQRVGTGKHGAGSGQSGLPPELLESFVSGCLGKISPRIRLAHHQHRPQRGALGTHLVQVGQRRLVANGHHGGAVLQAVGQRLGAKQHGQRHAHRPGHQHAHVGHRRFKPLRQHDGHPVTPLHPQPALSAQHIGQPTGLGMQIGIAVTTHFRAFAIGNDSNVVGCAQIRGPAHAAQPGHVHARRHLPAETLLHGGVVVVQGV